MHSLGTSSPQFQLPSPPPRVLLLEPSVHFSSQTQPIHPGGFFPRGGSAPVTPVPGVSPRCPPVSPRCPPGVPPARPAQRGASRGQSAPRLGTASTPAKKPRSWGKLREWSLGGLKKLQEPGPGGCKPPAAAGDGGEPGAGEARPKARRFGDRGSVRTELSVVIAGPGAALVLIPAACSWFLGWSGGAGCVPCSHTQPGVGR